MAKIRASEVRHGPIRWLLRLSGWAALITGIVGLLTGSEMVKIYFGGTGQALMGGIVCIALDILLAVTGPDKESRRSASARNNPQLKQVEQVYRQICKTLPTEDEGALLVKLTRQHGTAQLVQRTKSDELFCRSLFILNPSRQMLEFIHSHNPLASYKICADILKSAQESK